ncbi:flagellar hook protein FlgE [Candidatus Magnetomonas plexicatena]|uniref:flagellar hook protein FlgE n=1 Tax=Candidatus Magnetomonas plexicatena TaxID=2552947 RepID=UPI001C78A856|nr:flagellar hook protein FlgE [Nitrospirales bacterium LBB_01]
MLSSLWTAVSGMNSNSTSLSVVGDNIANMNTTGFKSSRADFGDVLSQAMIGTGGGQVGKGSYVTNIDALFTQGSFITTNNPTDLAIDGNGFFIVKDDGSTTASNSSYYTRAGNFSIDKSGYMVTPSGLRVQGYMASDISSSSVSSTSLSGNLTDIKINMNVSAAKETSNVDWKVNLNSSSSIITAAFTLDSNGDGVNEDPANYNYSTSTTIYDSQGGAHDITAYYTKTADNKWQVHYAYQQSSSSSVLTLASSSATQTLTFNTSGNLVSDGTGTDVSAITEPSITFNFLGGVATDQSVSFNFGTSILQGGSGANTTQQLADSSQVLDVSQNGNSSGTYSSMSIDSYGKITATYTNGLTKVIGQLALARFNNPNGLKKEGANMYGVTPDSGDAIVNTAQTSGLGAIDEGKLEQSNVDLGTEFVIMITNQRAFQANSKSVQTTDELLQDILSLKR